MELLVAVETILLIVIGVLVVGLLRSHAELLSRVDGERADSRAEPPLPAVREGVEAPSLVGVTLDGRRVDRSFEAGERSALLAFLSSGCDSCRSFWGAFRERPTVPGGAELIIVTKDPDMESPSKLEGLTTEGIELVLSSQAWADYDIPSYPFFVHVDGRSGQINGQGTASEWDQVASLLTDSLWDANGGKRQREAREDDDLEVAGIHPGHPSLYSPGDGDSSHDSRSHDSR
jgi:hypothetical protein